MKRKYKSSEPEMKELVRHRLALMNNTTPNLKIRVINGSIYIRIKGAEEYRIDVIRTEN